MLARRTYEPMVDVYILETTRLLDQLEQIAMRNEKNGTYQREELQEIFRIMHTLKGAASMMRFGGIEKLAHALENVFSYLREQPQTAADCASLTDMLLTAGDFVRGEIGKLRKGAAVDGDAQAIIERAARLLGGVTMKERPGEAAKPVSTQSPRFFYAAIFFEDGCDMENIRAYTIVSAVQEIAAELRYWPADVIENDDSAAVIRRDGFKLCFTTAHTYEEVDALLRDTILLKDLTLQELNHAAECAFWRRAAQQSPAAPPAEHAVPPVLRDVVSVQTEKLDALLKMTEDLAAAERMVTQNPAIRALSSPGFQESVRQLREIARGIQQLARAIRRLPLSVVFQNMNRLVRDMARKLDKEIAFSATGGEFEVDRRFLEVVFEAVLHIVRNAVDHGIERPSERLAAGKAARGTVTIRARTADEALQLEIADDGRGLDREKILRRARQMGLWADQETTPPDDAVYAYIFTPGFSTAEEVTEYSGRGVGMDVVQRNVRSIGGRVDVRSAWGRGAVITLHIPLR